MKKQQPNTTKNNPPKKCQKSPYKIVKVSREELKLSMKNACEEMEIIKAQNRTLIDYQHKFIAKE